jgi:hypothetical protein
VKNAEMIKIVVSFLSGRQTLKAIVLDLSRMTSMILRHILMKIAIVGFSRNPPARHPWRAGEMKEKKMKKCCLSCNSPCVIENNNPDVLKKKVCKDWTEIKKKRKRNPTAHKFSMWANW